MAELRSDDILVAVPAAAGSEPSALLEQVIEVAEAYAQSYQLSIRPQTSPTPKPVPIAEADSPPVRAMMYATVSERERLEALARELGSIRYGVEVGDNSLVDTALAEMRVIAASLPGKFRVHELIEVAARADSHSVRLTQLYLERGYRLCSEAYEELPKIEAEIALLQHEIERPG